jgi:hypothetical protein
LLHKVNLQYFAVLAQYKKKGSHDHPFSIPS